MKKDGKARLHSYLMHVWSGYEECMAVFLPCSVLIPSFSSAVLGQRKSLQSVCIAGTFSRFATAHLCQSG